MKKIIMKRFAEEKGVPLDEPPNKIPRMETTFAERPKWIWYEIAPDGKFQEFSGSFLWHINWQNIKAKQYFNAFNH